MATIFNVKDYGAVGDDGIDDTEALQAAIDAAAAAGGGTVYIPDGYYKVSTQSPGTVLVLKDNVSLQGQSLLVTLQLDEKTSTGDIDGIVHISGTNTSARNIRVDGFISTPYDGEASAWSIADGIKVTLDRIQAIGATGFGIDLRAEGSQVQLTNSMAYSNDGGGIIAAGLVNSTLIAGCGSARARSRVRKSRLSVMRRRETVCAAPVTHRSVSSRPLPPMVYGRTGA